MDEIFETFQTSMLTNIYTGEHTVTTYYSDGTSEVRLVPLSKPFVGECLFCRGPMSRDGKCLTTICEAYGD